MGTANVQGQIWGTRARDWADVQESVAIPLYKEILQKTGIGALREARRVSRTGTVVIAVFGKREENESAAYIAALGSLLAPPPPGAPGPYALSADGALEVIATEAEMTPGIVENVDCPWEYPDEKTALRGLLSSGPAIRAIQYSGEDVVRDVVLRVFAPFKTGSGGYCLKNTFRYMIAKA